MMGRQTGPGLVRRGGGERRKPGTKSMGQEAETEMARLHRNQKS